MCTIEKNILKIAKEIEKNNFDCFRKVFTLVMSVDIFTTCRLERAQIKIKEEKENNDIPY